MLILSNYDAQVSEKLKLRVLAFAKTTDEKVDDKSILFGWGFSSRDS